MSLALLMSLPAAGYERAIIEVTRVFAAQTASITQASTESTYPEKDEFPCLNHESDLDISGLCHTR